MSRCRFIHDFFQDGRSDVLSEVRLLQDLGLWTKQKRASWTKEAVSTYQYLRHVHQGQYQGSYLAGRIAALKRRQTAHFSEPGPHAFEMRDPLISRPLAPNAERFCSFFDCCETAIWGVCLWGDKQPALVLCDPCRQEWMRTETAYVTPDGWDWDEDERDLAYLLDTSLVPLSDIPSTLENALALLGASILCLALIPFIACGVTLCVVVQLIDLLAQELEHKA